jgi:hypothetical protein
MNRWLVALIVAIAVLTLWRVFRSRHAGDAPRVEPSSSGQRALLAPKPLARMDETPDEPAPFGYKICWLAVRTPRSEDVVAALPIEKVQRANWHTGCDAAHAGHVFVAPPVEGWVFVVSQSLPALDAEANSKPWQELMRAVAGTFDEVQFFGSHRVSGYHGWARFRGGREERAFAYCDGRILADRGEETAVEQELGLNFFDEDSSEARSPGYWEREDLRYPDEQYPMKVAEKWSINPLTLATRNVSPSTGWVGRFRE